MRIVLLTHNSSPRLEYVAKWIFEDSLECSYVIRLKEDFSLNDHEQSCVVNYSQNYAQSADVNIYAHGLLAQGDIQEQNITVNHTTKYPSFFEHSSVQPFDLSFDLFSLIFYLLTRYEEYLPSELDQHGRYISSQSLASRYEFIKMPLIDLWIQELKKIITLASQSSFPPQKRFSIHPTIDIDLPYAYRKRPVKKAVALLRDVLLLRTKRVSQRIQKWSSSTDPFDTYSYLLTQLKGFPNAIWFFLCKNEKPFDENHLIADPLFRDIVQKISKIHNIGIHPSYSSDSDYEKIMIEINQLTKLSDQNITASRQHYLKMNLPETYRVLIKAGITVEHSMMYPDQVGFRAATCHPFRWYDLRADEETRLMIYSPCIMDVTLKDYLKLTPKEAKSTIKMLKQSVKHVGGHFEYIWHNSSFSEIHGWTGWREVFEELNNQDT